jgi:non-specific serine/threonine protein kinase
MHTPLKHALTEFEGEQQKLLELISTVMKAAESSPCISDLMESGELFSPLKITADEAYTILKEIPLYEEAGIRCRVPDWWRKRNNAIHIAVKVGEKEPAKVGLDALLDFSPVMSLDGEQLTDQDVRAFMQMAEGIIQYKGKWVEIDKKRLEQVLKAFDKLNSMAQNEALTLADVLKLETSMNQLLDSPEDDLEVTIDHGQWYRHMRETLREPSKLEPASLVPSFKANLRTYQEQGYQWLHHMAALGFGACLADDMGLGKTVQMIAFLEYVRVNHGGRVLLVLPASLIGNWQKEIEKFASDMPYQILHKSDIKASEVLEINEAAFLYITTYGMTVRLDALKERTWDYLVLDEAQAIKNPGTKQTKAIKAISAKRRIAMTGTPIENHLGDLWSLFDFLNQGLLGTSREFTALTKELSVHETGYAKLRNMIQPFILRRLKTDKSIIADLPDKLEMNTYTTLSAKQVVLYEQLLQQIQKKLEEAEGIERKGLVLSSIMKFKQICNHPDQYLSREVYSPSHSGKFETLKELCETIYEKRERLLLFTQFKEMTGPLSNLLKEVFGREGFALHGGTSVKARSEMVKQFNAEAYVPYMVLSLKAGGVGLNLTAANHVIHFDRWWNPAVENQATDRAFRIGQTKDVLVHKFVTKGTIEEKIDAMIAEKRALSGELLSETGEQWITELSNAELMKIFALGGDK